jgi:predicted phosphodiesterase
VRYLILSDIHGNWEALEAVCNASAGQYDRVVCCGDLVGYGADPNAVTDWARASLAAVVRGNHDRASVGLDDLEWFNPVAKAAALWTGGQLSPENAAYIRQLPKGPLAVNGFYLVHGSPVDEDEYLVDAEEALHAFGYTPGAVAFFGHTHLQGGFIWRRSHIELIRRVDDAANSRVLDLQTEAGYLLNPGSVGQPRDGDPRAAYVLFDPQERLLDFRRVPYDVKTAQEKIRRAGLPPALADRLAAGR